jgi:hypothetical protein
LVTLILEFTFPANTVLLVLRVDDESGLDSEFIRLFSLAEITANQNHWPLPTLTIVMNIIY